MRGKSACCVALYDWKESADLSGWYAYCQQLFRRSGLPLELAAVDGSGFSGKPVTFKRVQKRLEDPEVLSRCPTVGLFSMEFRKYHSLMFGWRVHMSMEGLLTPVLFFGFDETLGICGQDLIRGIFKECLKWSLPAYGIAYTRQFEKSPDGYAVGMIAGLGYEERAERDSITAWLNDLTDKQYLKGMLRDVYSWNFLSDTHLNRSCGPDHTLRSWIEASKGRGVIEPLGRERYCWTVPDYCIGPIRAELHKHGMLIARPF